MCPTDKFQNADLVKHLKSQPLDPLVYPKWLQLAGDIWRRHWGPDLGQLLHEDLFCLPLPQQRHRGAVCAWSPLLSGEAATKAVIGSPSSATPPTGVEFTKVDLIAAEDGVAINVTAQTREISDISDGRLVGICAVLVSSPSPTANPCRAKIDAATAASMSASWNAAIDVQMHVPTAQKKMLCR
jgi:hypothetical protein